MARPGRFHCIQVLPGIGCEQLRNPHPGGCRLLLLVEQLLAGLEHHDLTLQPVDAAKPGLLHGQLRPGLLENKGRPGNASTAWRCTLHMHHHVGDTAAEQANLKRLPGSNPAELGKNLGDIIRIDVPHRDAWS